MASMPYNADALSKNFVLHTDRLYAMSGLFDATALPLGDKITVTAGKNGTATAPAMGTWGEKIELTITPAASHSVKAVTVNGNAITAVGGKYSFIMPNEEAKVNVTFN